MGFDEIASKLINERLFLTALELHMELIESGREISKLRDFFSNPANFERTSSARSNATLGESSPPRLARTASIQTFDSLDFARSSDDGERNENDRIAVLEFELRKAHETIRSLRSSLTRAAATEIPSDSEQALPVAANVPTVDEPARSYERRALNFLINEYLLKNDYKLTSVTFSEENVNQDFDDWDDVGLNVAKPPGLMQLYRECGQLRNYSFNRLVETCDFSCEVDIDSLNASEQLADVHQKLLSQLSQLEGEIRMLETENLKLSLTIEQHENASESSKKPKKSFHMLRSTPLASPIPSSNRAIDMHSRDGLFDVTDEAEPVEDLVNMIIDDSVDRTVNAMYETALDEVYQNEPESVVENQCNGNDEENSAEILSSVLSNSGTLRHEDEHVMQTSGSLNMKKLALFKQALVDAVFHMLPDNRIYAEVSQIAEQNKTDITEMVSLLARCIPFIVPNVLLAGREELIPLIVCSAALHSDSKTRDQLLNVLFNLIKRPDADQRRMILVGCVAFARHAGAARVESELLPQCWEQIAHKHVERRLLVAEACGALAAHIPPELRSSLLYSMLQQMIEDSSEDVREAAVRSLGVLIGFIEDSDKYAPIEALFISTLGDSSERVLAAAHEIFLPSLAVWSLELGCLETGLMSAFVTRIQKLVSSLRPAGNMPGASGAVGIVLPNSSQFCLLVNTLCQLMPVLLASFLSSAPFASNPLDGVSAGDINSSILPINHAGVKSASHLLNASLIVGGEEMYNKLLCAYEAYVSEEWYNPWQAYTWIANELVSPLKSIAEQLDASDQAIVHVLAMFFRAICHTFGSKFSRMVVRPSFQKSICFPAAEATDMSMMEHASLIRCITPVYIVGVLAAYSQDEDRLELTKVVTEFVQMGALHRCSFTSVSAMISELCSVEELSSGLPDLLLSVLWDGVVHPSPLVRSAAAQSFEPAIRSGGVAEQLIAGRIVPALVTLAGDSNPEVRASTVGALGALVECVSNRTILDKVYMQLQSLMDDPVYRDEFALSIALIRALGRAGPSAEPRFRDDFIVPRLTALAVQNSASSSSEVSGRRLEMAMALFDAYNSVSCCFFGEQLVSEVLLPGLRCLQRDLQQLSADHASIIASMIREFEDRADVTGSVTPSKSGEITPATNGSTGMAAAGVGLSSGDVIKSRMLSHIKDVKDRASHSNLNLSKIFTPNKK